MTAHDGWARGERLCVPQQETHRNPEREARKQHCTAKGSVQHGEACGDGVDDKETGNK